MCNKKIQFKSELVGYYSHGKGARYVNPLVTGAEFPELVELHESQHEYLAMSNLTDGVARLFAVVIASGERKLQPEHLIFIRDLQTTINRHSIFTHELLATYLSFLIFQGRGADKVSIARRRLPKFYEDVLKTGEKVFGCIGDNRIGANIHTITMALAIAALNLPFPVDIVRFSRIPECAKFIQKNSPDQRFRLILEHIKPLWEPNGILSDLYEVKVENEEMGAHLQGMVFERLRTELPQINFFTYQEWPKYISEWFEILMEDSQLFGYTFLQERVKVLDCPEDNAIERSNTRVQYPEIDEGDPLDLSLVRLKYEDVSIDDFYRAALLCQQGDCCLFVHVFNSQKCSRPGVACFASQSSQAAIRPFFTSCCFSELLAVLNRLPDASVIIKIDERLGTSVADQLASTGHPVFVLVHDTSTRNIVKLITSAAAHQNIMLSGIKLSGDEFIILLVQLLPKCHYFLAPITKLASTLIKQEFIAIENVRIAECEAEVLEGIKMNGKHLVELIETCYIH